jgi:hypothetical protein
MQGHLTEAEASLEHSAAEFNAEGNIRQEAISLGTLGGLRLQQGRLAEAETTLRRAVTLTRESGGELPAPTPMLNLASTLRDGATEEAIRSPWRGWSSRGGGERRVGRRSDSRCWGVRIRPGEFEKAARSYGRRSPASPDDERAGGFLGESPRSSLTAVASPALDAASRDQTQGIRGKEAEAGFGYVRRAGIRRRSGDVDGFAAT